MVLGLVCFGLGLSGFGLEFGDGGVVFGFGVIFQNDFLCCPKADDHVFDGGNVGLALTDFFANLRPFMWDWLRGIRVCYLFWSFLLFVFSSSIISNKSSNLYFCIFNFDGSISS